MTKDSPFNTGFRKLICCRPKSLTPEELHALKEEGNYTVDGKKHKVHLLDGWVEFDYGSGEVRVVEDVRA